MNRVTVTLPDKTYRQLKQLAKREGVSVSQYVTYAIAKQVEQVEVSAAVPASSARSEENAGSAAADSSLDDVAS
ncbi:MAG: ribbon-helix-helix protein, CopG family [Cyanobacteria bacterium J06560_2]